MRNSSPVPIQQLARLVFGILLLAAAWEIATLVAVHFQPQTKYLYPSSPRVTFQLVKLLTTADFWSAVAYSNARVLVSLLLAWSTAVAASTFLFFYRPARLLLEAPLDFLRYLPVPALMPLLVLWLGIGESMKITTLSLGAFFPLVAVVMSAYQQVPKEFVDDVGTFTRSRAVCFRYAIWPAALPALFDSFRVGSNICWSYVVLAELVAPRNGLGFQFDVAQKFLNISAMICIVVIFGVLGVLYDLILRSLRRKLFPWTQLHTLGIP